MARINGGRAAMAWSLAAAVAMAGCGSSVPANPHDHGGGMVDEYRPLGRPVVRPAPGSAEYVLWRWQAVPAVVPAGELLRPATGPTSRPAGPARWVPAVQVVHIYVHHGQPVGFRRRPDGLLVAVAGPTTRALPPGRYCWHLLPGRPAVDYGDDGHATAGLLVVGAVVAAVVGVIALPFVIDHVDHHAHLVKSIGRGLDAVDDGE